VLVPRVVEGVCAPADRGVLRTARACRTASERAGTMSAQRPSLARASTAAGAPPAARPEEADDVYTSELLSYSLERLNKARTHRHRRSEASRT
jgi:hypothetical protein